MIVQRFIQIQTCLRIKMLCSALIYHKLLMQKGIRAFADQVTRVHLSTSCSSQSCSVHLDFETSFSHVHFVIQWHTGSYCCKLVNKDATPTAG